MGANQGSLDRSKAKDDGEKVEQVGVSKSASWLDELPEYFKRKSEHHSNPARASINLAMDMNRRVSVSINRSIRRQGSSVHEQMVNIHTDRNIRDDYDGLDDYRNSLGQGSWGTVWTIHRKNYPSQKYACKILRISQQMTQMRLHELRREISLLSKLDHSHIVKLKDTYEDEGCYLYLVMELLSGKELFDRLEQHVHYSESKARHVLKQMVGAIAYLHERGIVHRDLKLENFIYRSQNSEDIVLIDFGLSCRYREGLNENHLQQVVGSSYYMAPEVQDQNYDSKCDMWSLGVIAYMLLSGTPPFAGSNDDIILRKAYKGVYRMPKGTVWDRITVKAKSFVQSLLRRNPAERLSAEEALRHPWLADENIDHLEVALPPGVVKSLVKFSHTEKFKKVALQAVAYSADYEDIEYLHRLFGEIDTDNDGYLSLQDLEAALLERNGLDSEAIKDIFNAMDIDKMGRIHVNEFIAAALNENIIKDENLLLQAFGRLDVDENGVIDRNDLETILGEKLKASELKEIFGSEQVMTKKEFISRMRTRNFEKTKSHLAMYPPKRRSLAIEDEDTDV